LSNRQICHDCASDFCGFARGALFLIEVVGRRGAPP
jgi:hypothetical protein